MGRLISLRLQALLRRSALGLVGIVCLLVGLGFLTAALWQLLVLWNGPVAAALVLALIWIGAGLVLLAVARPPPPPPPLAHQPLAELVAALLDGIEAGVRSRRGPAAAPESAPPGDRTGPGAG